MPIRACLLITAFGLTLASSGQAQEQTEGPAGQATGQEQPSQPLPIPLPVEIIEDKADAQARVREEAAANKREIRDLTAQEGMNTAAQEMNEATQLMATYALISAVIAGAGVVFLIPTLRLTAKTNRAAHEANQIARAELRPWVTYELGNSILIEKRIGGSTAKLSRTIRNRGKSPAFAVSYLTYLRSYDAPALLKDVLDEICSMTLSDEGKGMFPIVFQDDVVILDAEEASVFITPDGAGTKRAILTAVFYRLSPDLKGPFGVEGRAYRVVDLGEDATERNEFGLVEYTSYRIAR